MANLGFADATAREAYDISDDELKNRQQFVQLDTGFVYMPTNIGIAATNWKVLSGPQSARADNAEPSIGNLPLAGGTLTGPLTIGVDGTGYDFKLFSATPGKYFLWDESADKLIVVGDADVSGTATIGAAGSIVMTAGASLVSSVATVKAPFVPVAVQEAVSTATALALTTAFSTIDSTSGALALTLANPTVVGQSKKVQMIVDGGDATLTFNATATIVFADVGDVAELMFNGSLWIPVALYNLVDGATAPVYTPA